MDAREAVLLLAAVGLAAGGVQAGLYTPTDEVLTHEAISAEKTTIDRSAECESGIDVGVAAVDVTPYEPMTWNEPWADVNQNGVYDAPDPTSGDQGEPFVDENSNGKFDGLFMAGYGHDKEDNDYYMAEDVHDPIWARSIAVTCGDTTLGLTSVDSVGLLRGPVLEVREKAPAAFDHVTVASTHAHGSIDTMGLWGPSILMDGKHPAFMDRLKDDIARSLRKALASQELVDAVKTSVAHSKDLHEEAGSLHTDLRDPFFVDDRILSAQFLDGEGDTIATLVNWGNHPETLAAEDGSISSDYPHYLREAIETEGATLGGETKAPVGGTTVFFSGALGGLIATLYSQTEDEQGQVMAQATYEKAERVGEAAAWAVLDSLADAETTRVDELHVEGRAFSVPADNPFLLALNTIGLFDRPSAVGPAEVHPVGEPGVVVPAPFFRTEVNAFTFGTQGEPAPLQMLAIPGELFPEIAFGEHLGHAPEADLDRCYAYDEDKHTFNSGTIAKPNPETGEREEGFERQLAANPHVPEEPAFGTMSEAEHVMMLGLANDELGYIVPADDYVYPTVFPDIYNDGTDRCGDSDHYEETNSASSYLGPAVANALAGILDEGFEPEPMPTRVAGPVHEDGSAPALTDWKPGQTAGVWVDTSRSGGYEAEEDAHARVNLPDQLPGPGCWGFVDGHGHDMGQQPTEEARGLWIDQDGDCKPGQGDGLVFLDAWALSENRPYHHQH